MKKLLISLAAAMSLSFLSCGGGGKNEPVKNPPTIYVAGVKDSKATLWINGKALQFSNTDRESSAEFVFVSNNGDIYVAGREHFSVYESRSKAKLWKVSNGVLKETIDLTDGNHPAAASFISVIGNDVHVTGYDEVSSKLWKVSNGAIKETINLGVNEFRTFISGNNIYVTTQQQSGGAREPKLLKISNNGILTETINLYDGPHIGSLTNGHSLFVSKNGDAYVSGWEARDYEYVPKLWKVSNGVVETINLNSKYDFYWPTALSIFAHGNNIYVAEFAALLFNGWPPSPLPAYRNRVLKVSNGTVKVIADFGDNTRVDSIFVSDNGNVYVIGKNSDYVCLWVFSNDVLVETINLSNNGYASSVLVK